MGWSRGTFLLADVGVVLWIALVSGSSVLFSMALACATPFAALATVAGFALRRGPALGLVGTAWIANQAVGYGLLGYPRTPDTFAWGAPSASLPWPPRERSSSFAGRACLP